MKKLFAGIITCATILLTGIGVSATAADENNSGDENVQSEIAFCVVNSEKTGKTVHSYGGFFIESNGNVRHFSFEDIEDNWMLIFGSGYFSNDGNIELNEAMPHEKLLSRLNDNISEYKVIGSISKEEYTSKALLLSEVDTSAKIPFVPFEIVQTVGMTSYTESFGVRYDNDDNAQIVFMNGHVSGDMKYRTYLENPDEKSIELNNWLIEKCMSFMSSEPITTTTPTTPDATTTTTVTTTDDSSTSINTSTEELTTTDSQTTAVQTTTAAGTTTPTSTTGAEGIVTTETSTVPTTVTTPAVITTETGTKLPQTGYSIWYQSLVAVAMGMVGVGSAAIVKSGVFRKKESNS